VLQKASFTSFHRLPWADTEF